MHLDGSQILVVGLGISGSEVVEFLVNRGARVRATDGAINEALVNQADHLRQMGVAVELGSYPLRWFETADAIIISPGVPHTLAPVQYAMTRGIPVMGEIELASRFIREPIVAVTGTNGKTTVTMLISEMLRKSGKTVFTGGNIGTPLIRHVRQAQPVDVVVAEISSFQLDTIHHFCPHVAAILNITQDHMDRYPDFTAYASSKFRILENQAPSDVAVLNGMDPVIRSMAQDIRSQVRWIWGGHLDNPQWMVASPPVHGARMDTDQMEIRLPGIDPFPVASSPFLRGMHQVENAAISALCAMEAGATPRSVAQVLHDFRGLPHRIQYVATIAGVAYYNDSKATNPDAVKRALEAFEEPVVLIMGGQGKGNDFATLKDSVRQKVRHLILMGESAEEIERNLGPVCSNHVNRVGSMEEAVALSARIAADGDVVLLSPACASFDMYNGYAHRGDVFCKAVNQLK